MRGEGIVVDDLTLVAVDQRGNKIIAAGRDAQTQVQHSNGSLQLLQPLQDGTVSDPTLAGVHLASMVRPFAGGRISRYSLLLTVPTSATPMERRVLREAGKRAGASRVRLIEQTMAAAIGGELSVDEAAGTLIVNVGAGITEVSLVSLGSVVASSVSPSGGSSVDAAIKYVLRREYGIAITDASAELVKLAASGATASAIDTPMIEARGVAIADGLVTTAILEVSELQSALDAHANDVINTLKRTLVQAAPELSQDILVRGIHLAGAAAMSTGLASRIAEVFGIPVHVLGRPQHAAVLGAGSCLDAANSLQELFLAERS